MISWEDAVKEFKQHNKENKRKERTIEWYDQILKPLTATFGKMTMQAITRPMVLAYRTSRLETIGNTTANAELTVIKRIYSILLNIYTMRTHPLLHTAADEIQRIHDLPETAKTRNLTMKEIQTLWNTDKLSTPVHKALKLILLTGQRPGEVTGINAAEIDGNWWTIPAERSKNGIANRVWLSDESIKLAQDVNVDRNWLSKNLQRVDLGIEDFTPHDLRRTMSTQLAQMGVMDEVIDAILNHQKQGVIRVYNQYKYDSQKMEAFKAWENKLYSFLSSHTKVIHGNFQRDIKTDKDQQPIKKAQRN